MSTSSWTQQWQESFQKIEDLLEFLDLPQDALEVTDSYSDFPFRVPRSFAERMEKGNMHDPLLRQVLPLIQERLATSGFTTDPLAEKTANPLPGVLHKYKNRVLLTLSGACAVHCRYCFRRHFPYKSNNPGTKGWEPIFDYLVRHSEVNELILSGGDPLSIHDALLETFIRRLESIDSIKYLRFHTRLPIVIPDRITPEFLAIIQTTRFRTVMVLHSNHANEWNKSLQLPMQQLRMAGVTLLNQAVLLRGVNDSLPSQIALNYRLFDYGVIPYYLHLVDKVAGVAHFDVSQEEAILLMRQLAEALPGYLVPKLVREIPHRTSKIPIDLGME